VSLLLAGVVDERRLAAAPDSQAMPRAEAGGFAAPWSALEIGEPAEVEVADGDVR
jgi:hypothetical protein